MPSHSDGMDIVAIVIGVAVFAILLLLIEGVDRV
jgi:multisubunit Na+/H+ antiporter MnhC subunit